MKYCGWGIPHNWDMSFWKIGGLPTLQGRNKLIILSMSANEFTKVPHTIRCKISQGKGDYNQMEPFSISEQ